MCVCNFITLLGGTLQNNHVFIPFGVTRPYCVLNPINWKQRHVALTIGFVTNIHFSHSILFVPVSAQTVCAEPKREFSINVSKTFQTAFVDSTKAGI